jgi:hypothetical protein
LESLPDSIGLDECEQRGEKAADNPVDAEGSWGGHQVPQDLVPRPESTAACDYRFGVEGRGPDRANGFYIEEAVQSLCEGDVCDLVVGSARSSQPPEITKFSVGSADVGEANGFYFEGAFSVGSAVVGEANGFNFEGAVQSLFEGDVCDLVVGSTRSSQPPEITKLSAGSFAVDVASSGGGSSDVLPYLVSGSSDGGGSSSGEVSQAKLLEIAAEAKEVHTSVGHAGGSACALEAARSAAGVTAGAFDGLESAVWWDMLVAEGEADVAYSSEEENEPLVAESEAAAQAVMRGRCGIDYSQRLCSGQV